MTPKHGTYTHYCGGRSAQPQVYARRCSEGVCVQWMCAQPATGDHRIMPSTSSPAIAEPARSRLPPPWRKLLLAGHVTVSVGLLGTDSAVLTLVASGWLGTKPITVYPAAHMIGTYLLLPLALLAVLTGVALGLLTRWGLLRYWWVLISLVATSAGTLLAVFVLLPELDSAASAATADQPVTAPSGLVVDSGAACLVLAGTVLISYYKPLGRIRGTGRQNQ